MTNFSSSPLSSVPGLSHSSLLPCPGLLNILNIHALNVGGLNWDNWTLFLRSDFSGSQEQVQLCQLNPPTLRWAGCRRTFTDIHALSLYFSEAAPLGPSSPDTWTKHPLRTTVSSVTNLGSSNFPPSSFAVPCLRSSLLCSPQAPISRAFASAIMCVSPRRCTASSRRVRAAKAPGVGKILETDLIVPGRIKSSLAAPSADFLFFFFFFSPLMGRAIFFQIWN